ncbi:MAG: formate dehydrogenase subunit gamma, partial [Gammaproteobacteria bacterium]
MSSTRVYVPRDASARAVGADAVADALRHEASARGLALEIVRNGSRGMAWLEPLVEVECAHGRIAYGPVTVADVRALLDRGLLAGGPHALRQGTTAELPWLARQERLTFARVGLIDPLDTTAWRAHGGGRGLAHALDIGAEAIIATITESGLRGRGGAAFPAGVKWRTVAQTQATRKYIVCNA